MADLTHIKAGDRVVLEGGRASKSELRLGTVMRLTPTQIVLGSNRRYNRLSGKPIGAASHAGWISGIATKKQIATWEARQDAEVEAFAAKERRRLHMLKEREELYALLLPSHPHVYLNFVNDAWEVSFPGLSSEQVRKLARKVTA